MAAATFDNEDEEAQHCLSLLRDGTPSEKVEARERLARIFTSRGLFLEATELYEANVRAGVRAPELFERLSASYRRIGDVGAAAAALAEARRLREAASPRPIAPEPQPAPTPTAPPSWPTAPHSRPARPAGPPPRDDDADRMIQFPTAPTDRLPAQPLQPAAPQASAPQVRPPQASMPPGAPPPASPPQASLPLAETARMSAAQRHAPDADLTAEAAAAAPRPRRQRGLALPGPLVVLLVVVFLIVLPVVTLALLVVNPVALYLEGRPAGPTVEVAVAASAPPRLKVAPGAQASWYVESGRSVSGLWATPGLELTLDQELAGAGTTFAVTAPRPQTWGETITIVERRGQGRSNQDTVLLATFAAPSTLPPAGTVLGGRIAGQVTAPRLSESSQFNTTTEGIDVPVQLVVVSTPELWLDRFQNSLAMFFQEDRWLLVTIGALLTWCVLAGGTAILFRARQN